MLLHPLALHHIISYYIVHFSGASSKTPAPQPLNKQVSFQQCCKCSRRQCRVTNASSQAVPDAWVGDGKWSVTQCSSCLRNVEHRSTSWSHARTTARRVPAWRQYSAKYAGARPVRHLCTSVASL